MTRWILSFLFLSGICCNGKNEIPEHILAPKAMQEVMWDVMVADEINLHQRQSDSTLDMDSNRVQLYETVFRKHRTSKDQFHNSLRFYQRHPDQLKVILDTLQKRSELPPTREHRIDKKTGRPSVQPE